MLASYPPPRATTTHVFSKVSALTRLMLCVVLRFTQPEDGAAAAPLVVARSAAALVGAPVERPPPEFAVELAAGFDEEEEAVMESPLFNTSLRCRLTLLEGPPAGVAPLPLPLAYPPLEEEP
jgi:hypothetical protein